MKPCRAPGTDPEMQNEPRVLIAVSPRHIFSANASTHKPRVLSRRKLLSGAPRSVVEHGSNTFQQQIVCNYKLRVLSRRNSLA